MILKVKFIFIMDYCITSCRNGGRHGAATGLTLALALAFVLGAPAAWAQAQSASASTQTAAPAAPDAGDPPSPPSDAIADTEAMFPHFKSTRFWLSGQANFIFQTHPDFHADYSGPHSLSPDYDKSKKLAARRSAPAWAWPGIRIWTSCAIRC